MKRKSIYLITSIIISLNMIGCGGTTPIKPYDTETNANPTETVEPSLVEEKIVEEIPSPAESSGKLITTNESNYISGGIDFTDYFTSDKDWYTIVNESAKEDVLIIVKTFSDLYVLKDGDSFEMERKEENLIGYKFFVYSSKAAISIDVPDKWKDIVEIGGIDKDYGNIKYAFTIKKDVTINNRDLEIFIDYEDGTQDTISICLNKPYIYKVSISK